MRRLTVKRYFRVNNRISAAEVRLLDQEGKQLGIVPLGEALKKAQSLGTDLVEIGALAKPPVAKLIDFKKFKYLEEKREKEARKHTKQTELKEVRFTPFIGEHDFETALERVKRFLSDGNMVKIAIVFTGRQMAHLEFGPKLLVRILAQIEAQKERDEKMEGRRLVTVVRPIKKSQLEKGKQAENEKQTEN